MLQDANPAELALVLEPLGVLLRRVGLLLEEWPENPILQQLVAICQRVTSLPLDTPIMQVSRSMGF